MKKKEVIIAIVGNAYLLPEDKLKAIEFIQDKFEWRNKDWAKEAEKASDWIVHAFNWTGTLYPYSDVFWSMVYDGLVEAEDGKP